MPFFGRPDFIESSLAQVMALGYVPVLAHPERIEAKGDRETVLVVGADVSSGGALP